MANAKYTVPLSVNEPVQSYLPGSRERTLLKEELKRLKETHVEIPLIIGGSEIKTGKLARCIIPHDHGSILASFHQAGEQEIEMAIEAARQARADWAETDWEDRISIFLKAAEILAGPKRYTVNAATMLCQSKTVFQAEIDAACELTDFFRFNAYYATQIYEGQPPYSPEGIWNRMEYRPLEGFIFAVTPFNFLSIAGNLPSAPVIAGNVSLWKPASTAVYSAYRVMQIFQEAGLPDGVINFIPGPGSEIGPMVLRSPDLAGIHFTGNSSTLQSIWETVGRNIKRYRSYPRIIGETGGKDFIVAHVSTDIQALSTALIRGAFEYQGQKCSAVSRAYIPAGVWRKLRDFLGDELQTVKMGDIQDFSTFMGAVIDKSAFDKIAGYIDYIRESNEAKIIFGGGCDDSSGYFIEPTVALTTDPRFRTMQEEIFGPVLTVYVYKDDEFEDTLHLCDETSPYALTGAVFARDRKAIAAAEKILVNAAGNFYINDKPTGAVVSQQPFGGSRASGTNDKAGSIWNMMRWVSPRAVKENFMPPHDYRYPYMDQD